MTSFDTSPQLNVWRTLLALAVVFVMLATTGWTALRTERRGSALQASLSEWEHGRLRGHQLPDPDTTPGRLARFFASLTAQQRTTLADRYPLAVGNMNGAPVELRYRANRIALGQARKVERKRMHDTRLTPNGQQDAGRRMHRYESLMHQGPPHPGLRPRRLRPGRRGVRQPDRAERVSVVVPGVDTDLLTFQRTDRRYSAPVGMAKALYKAERAASPSTRTAVIAWADYTAPAGLGIDAATAMRAADGAVRLNSLVRALPGSSPVSLFCHSYGSVVCGLAARSLPGRVADIAVAGSPGMRVGERLRVCAPPHRCGRCGTPTTGFRTCRTWRSAGSVTAPTRCPPRSVPGCCRRGGAEGHSGYFVPGTESLSQLRRDRHWRIPSGVLRGRYGSMPDGFVRYRRRPDARRGEGTAVCAGRGRRSSCRIR